MKKFIAIVIAVAIPLCSAAAVYGADEEPGSFDAGTAAVMIEEGLRNAYEVSVIEQLAGRCGMTYTGAKGLVFEILAKDKLNLQSLFNKEFTTRLTLSPNAVRADLVSVGSSGNVVDFYQCKNATSTSGIRNIFNQVKNGKYPWTKLIGTTETAEGYNAMAAANGSSSTMIDSGISTETTTRIADKALGLGANLSGAATVGLKTGTIGAGVNAVISLVDCIIHHRSFAESVGKVSIQSIKGFACGYGTGFLVELAGAGLAAAGAGTVTMIVLPVAVGVGAGIVTCYILDKAIEASDVEARLADLTKAFGDKVQTAVVKGKELIAAAAEYIGGTAENISKTVTEEILPTIKGTFEKAVLKARTGIAKLSLNNQ